MSSTVKLSDDQFIVDARAEADIQGRSLAEQIMHWVRIGRAVERSGNYDHAKVLRALMGELETTALTSEEKTVWSDVFWAKMSGPGPAEEAFLQNLRKTGKAVGLDASGKIVRLNAKS